MIPAGFMTQTLGTSTGLNPDLMFQNLKNMCSNTLFNLPSNSDHTDAAILQTSKQSLLRNQKKGLDVNDRSITENTFSWLGAESNESISRAREVSKILTDKVHSKKISFEDYLNYLLWIPWHKDIPEGTITLQFWFDALAIYYSEIMEHHLGRLNIGHVASRDVLTRPFNAVSQKMQKKAYSMDESMTVDRYMSVSKSILLYVHLHAEIVNGIQMNFTVEFSSNGLLEVKA